MCNKYTLRVGLHDKKSKLLVDICNQSAQDNQKIDLHSLSGILPNDNAPALMMFNRQATAVSMRWGFSAKGGKLIINARIENVKDRITFKGLVDHQRCALPASGYYEWRDGDNLRHLIQREDGQDFYLAGLYRSDEHGRLHFVVLTRAAYGPHAKIHPRMPCILNSREEARRWISGAMPIESFQTNDFAALSIEVQGPDQLMMDFCDAFNPSKNAP